MSSILQYKGNEDLFEFYWAYRDFYKKVENLSLGIGIMSWVFTEEIVRRIYKMKPSEVKGYDAVYRSQGKDRKIEIKTTINDNVRVKVNCKHKFDFLFWSNINFSQNIITVKVFRYSDVVELVGENKSRNIGLNDLKNCKHRKQYEVKSHSIVKIDTI